MGRRCSQDPRQLCAQTEDGPARCGPYPEVAAGETVSPVVDAERQRCGISGSCYFIGISWFRYERGEEQLAAPGDEPGGCKRKEGCGRKGREQFQLFAMPGWKGTRREDCRELLTELDRQIVPLDQAAKQAAEDHPQAQLLMHQTGVGPITALAFALTIGEVTRFAGTKQLTSYLGLIPREYSSGNKHRLGSITKQGNCFLRKLLVEAAQTTVRNDEGFHKEYLHLCQHRPKAVAKVAAARKLAVRLYWMLRSDEVTRRSCISRATRGCPWAKLARNMDWVLSRPDRFAMQKTAQAPWKTPPGVSHFRTDSAAGCPYRRIMIVVFARMDRSGRAIHQKSDSAVISPESRSHSLCWTNKAVLRTAQDIFALDKAFFLIEGHPYGVVETAAGLRGRPAVSHISRKTSEMSGRPGDCAGDRAQKPISFIRQV